MSVIHADVLKDPFVFNSDRNNWMSGGGLHTWNASYEWTFTTPIYINWLAGRSTGSASRRGTANFNQINATTVTLAVDTCAYVVLDPNTDGSLLTVVVTTGALLPQGDNVFVLAMHRDLGLTPLNPLLLRWGNSIPVGGSYDANVGFPTFGYANNYSGATWTISHSLNSTDCVVCLQDNSTPTNQIWPANIEFTDVNTVTVTFSTSVTGRAVVIKAV